MPASGERGDILRLRARSSSRGSSRREQVFVHAAIAVESRERTVCCPSSRRAGLGNARHRPHFGVGCRITVSPGRRCPRPTRPLPPTGVFIPDRVRAGSAPSPLPRPSMCADKSAHPGPHRLFTITIGTDTLDRRIRHGQKILKPPGSGDIRASGRPSFASFRFRFHMSHGGAAGGVRLFRVGGDRVGHRHRSRRRRIDGRPCPAEYARIRVAVTLVVRFSTQMLVMLRPLPSHRCRIDNKCRFVQPSAAEVDPRRAAPVELRDGGTGLRAPAPASPRHTVGDNCRQTSACRPIKAPCSEAARTIRSCFDGCLTANSSTNPARRRQPPVYASGREVILQHDVGPGERARR